MTIAVFPCARVRGNFLEARENPSRSAVAVTAVEGMTRGVVQLSAAEARKLAIWLLQRAEELGA